MNDPIELLKGIYPSLTNGDKAAAKGVKEAVLEMQAHIADLESALARQPLPEAPASITVKVVDPASQFDYLVTVREARAGIALIGRIPEISAALMELGLVAMDAYSDGRRAERQEGKSAGGNGGVPNCPDGHGPMKASTKVDGEFYCSHSVGVHPQTQKKLYCMHKARG